MHSAVTCRERPARTETRTPDQRNQILYCYCPCGSAGAVSSIFQILYILLWIFLFSCIVMLRFFVFVFKYVYSKFFSIFFQLHAASRVKGRGSLVLRYSPHFICCVECFNIHRSDLTNWAIVNIWKYRSENGDKII